MSDIIAVSDGGINRTDPKHPLIIVKNSIWEAGLPVWHECYEMENPDVRVDLTTNMCEYRSFLSLMMALERRASRGELEQVQVWCDSQLLCFQLARILDLPMTQYKINFPHLARLANDAARFWRQLEDHHIDMTLCWKRRETKEIAWTDALEPGVDPREVKAPPTKLGAAKAIHFYLREQGACLDEWEELEEDTQRQLLGEAKAVADYLGVKLKR